MDPYIINEPAIRRRRLLLSLLLWKINSTAMMMTMGWFVSLEKWFGYV